ncbi:MAG: hypothetical protein MH825_09285 [Cyanobacteria bacterium]|nr:hypothetical protein [Cyanobacteriota bacterium]
MQVSLSERFRGLWLGAYGALALQGDGRGRSQGASVALDALRWGMGIGGGGGVLSASPLGPGPLDGVTTPMIALGAGVVAGLGHHDELQEGVAAGLELALVRSLAALPLLSDGDHGMLRPWFEAIAWGVAGAIAPHPPYELWLRALLAQGVRRTWGEPVQSALREALGSPLPLAPDPLEMTDHAAPEPDRDRALDLEAPRRILAATFQAIAQTGGTWTLAVEGAARTGGWGAALLTGAIAGAIGGAQRIDPDALLALDAAATAQAIAQGEQHLNRWAGRLDAIAPMNGSTAAPFAVLAPSPQVFRRSS